MRIQSIDAFRGLTIMGMIFCAAIGYNSGLPNWMFHGQVPPPDYVFHPEVRVLTWVDLVFPFFIFAMGAAFPFSLRKKIERGEAWWKVLLGVVKRFAILVVFSLVLGHMDALYGCSGTGVLLSPWGKDGIRLVAWLALFAALVRTERGWINYVGWGVLAAVFALVVFVCGVPFSWHTNDCIIMLLSWVALFGSLIWIVTRDSLRLRVLIWLLLVAVKLVGWNFLQYLVIAVPASMVGDLMLESLALKKNSEGNVSRAGLGWKEYAAAAVAFAAVVLQLWGLYVREVLVDGLVTACLGAAFVLLTYKRPSMFSQIGWMGFALLLVGICFDPVDGGIAKDYCNMCYLLTCGGMAALTLAAFVALESCVRLPKFMTMTGQNPMIAYTVPWYVISPLLYKIGLLGTVDAWCVGSPVAGLLRGVLITSLTALCACLCTHWKLFWRA